MKDKILTLGKNSISSKDYDILYDTAKGSKVVLEVGARYGCSTMLFGTIAEKVYSVESDPLQEWFENLREMNLTNVELLHGYSPWINVNEDIDYLFIDGDHRSMFCITDYVYFMPFLNVGGKVAFHDTANKVENCEFTVGRALDIIIEESGNLKEIARNNEPLGTIVFEKTRHF